ncbi:MAG: sugar kinase, partial [Pseudomonadota bacterium]
FAHEAGICTDHAIRRDDRTLGLYVISLEAGERSFSYWRGNSAARTLADDPEALAVALADSDLVYFSGITLGILDQAARDRLLAGIRIVKTGGTLVVFDPNLRPKLWPDADTMTKAVSQAAEVSSIVLPSFEDEQVHFGDTSPDATIARYLGAGATSVVVKDGSNAISYVHHEAMGRVEIEAVTDIVDTTAAGDSFNAGFLASLNANADMPTAIARGAGLARHVIGSRGALVPL